MKYFVSIDRLIDQAPKIWNKYYTIGNFKIADFNKEKNYTILRIENFNLHPLHCLHMRGYCSNVIKMVVKRNVSCEETKCIHKGDAYHEFLMKW
jgi:hypothetical protein